MSTCNCDGSFSTSLSEKLFGDSVLKSLGINESQFNPLEGGADPRDAACQQAVGELRGSGQDPCNLDSPDDLQVLYQTYIPGAWAIIQSQPLSNSLQKAVDTAVGTATGSTAVLGSGTAPSGTNWTFVIGAVLILLVGFVFVFR